MANLFQHLLNSPQLTPILSLLLISTWLMTCRAQPTPATPATPPTPTPISTILPAATAEATQLLPTPSNLVTATAPISESPSPDSLLYLRSNGDLFVYEPASQQERLLLADSIAGMGECQYCSLFYAPIRPSPDGKWLLVPTLARGTWLVAVDGSQLRQLHAQPLSATWSPDSQRLIFVAQHSDPQQVENRQLFVLDVAKEGEAELLAELPSRVFFPTWSPACNNASESPTASCGRHAFAISSCPQNANETTCTVWLIDMQTKQTTALGEYLPIPSEVTADGFAWNEAGNAIWLRDSSGIRVFPIDGNPSAPAACLAAALAEQSSIGGWRVQEEWGERGKFIRLNGPSGEEQIIEGVHLVGQWRTLRARSTEVVSTVQPQAYWRCS